MDTNPSNSEFRLENETPDFPSLCNHYQGRLLLWIRYRMDESLNSRMDPEDVLQEVYLIAHRKFSSFSMKRPVDFFHWMKKIIDRRIQDLRKHHRAEKRDVGNEERLSRYESPSGTSFQLPNAQGTTPSKDFELNANLNTLFRHLGDLPPLQRDAIMLVKIGEIPVREAARQLGERPEKVSLALIRGAGTLRQLMDRDPGG